MAEPVAVSVPSCSSHVSGADWNAADAASFDPSSPQFYRVRAAPWLTRSVIGSTFECRPLAPMSTPSRDGVEMPRRRAWSPRCCPDGSSAACALRRRSAWPSGCSSSSCAASGGRTRWTGWRRQSRCPSPADESSARCGRVDRERPHEHSSPSVLRVQSLNGSLLKYICLC